MNSCAETCNQNPCGSVTIVQGMSGSFYVDLFYPDTNEPFNLTGVTEIVASFPPTTPANGPIFEKYSLSQISIIGAAGAGKIQINYAAVDSSLMQVNPNTQQFQDLQVVATLNGVAQIDTLSLASPTPGAIYSTTINGLTFTYTAGSADTSQNVFTALAAAINLTTLASGLTAVLSAVVSGTGNSATLVLTSLFPGLGFIDIPSATLTKVATTANAGTRSTFILQATLNIAPPSYSGS